MASPSCLKERYFKDFLLALIFLVLIVVPGLYIYNEKYARHFPIRAFRTISGLKLPFRYYEVSSSAADNVSANAEDGRNHSGPALSSLEYYYDRSTPSGPVNAKVEDDGNRASSTLSKIKYKYSDTTSTPAESWDVNVQDGKNAPSQGEILRQFEKKFRVEDVNCASIFDGVDSEIEKGRQLAAEMQIKPLLSGEFYLSETADCRSFISKRGYITSYLTEDEREFPIAFAIVAHRDLEMLERLLRAIYRPQNIYCIHVDAKSKDVYYEAVAGISGCFPNVFLASRRIDVRWGMFTVTEPTLQCMEDLRSRGKKWKYFINLTGQEFPLKTNAELVAILKAYNGANDISCTLKSAWHRWGRIPPPKEILRLVKGADHIVVNRQYVDYIFCNETGRQFLAWAKETSHPGETFFPTLNHNPNLGIPGSYLGVPQRDEPQRKPFLARFKDWGGQNCAGYIVRDICILSTGDMPRLKNATQMFANKFHLQKDRIVVGCLEERHFNDTRDEYFGLKTFNTTYYQNVGFVKDQVPPWTIEDAKLNTCNSTLAL